MNLKKFRVGVFTHEGKRKHRYLAYTTWFNPAWQGCCIHEVEALNGAEAKRVAIREHWINCEASVPLAAKGERE